VRFAAVMSAAADPSSLSRSELEAEAAALRGEVAELKQLILALREENARLKGLKGRPVIRPSGMEDATTPKRRGRPGRRRGKVVPRVPVETRVLRVAVPPGAQFKGYEPYQVQDLEIRARVVRYRRKRWLTPDGQTIVAPLPPGTRGHFGRRQPRFCRRSRWNSCRRAELRRWVLMQHHQGQVTVERLLVQLQATGISISKREVTRLLIDQQDEFLTESREVPQAGLATAAWVSVDDTGARHRGANAVCTQIGNDSLAWFGTTGSKSRQSFLELLRAGHTDHVVSDAALEYVCEHGLSSPVVRQLAGHGQRQFADQAAWQRHLEQLGVTALEVTPDPVRVATEGALWGAVAAHGFLNEAVIVSDDAGQFNVGEHALCWIHAERLAHKLEALTDQQRAAQQRVRGLIWWFYAGLKAHRAAPTARRRRELRARFDRIFRRRTGFVSLDRLPRRLHANEAELLKVLDRPEIPLHTNGSENDIRCQVTKRHVSGGIKTDLGRDCRNAFLGLSKTCRKLGISFWNYLGARLGVPSAPPVPRLAEVIRCRGQPA
jgi:Transposase IS66 family